MKKIFCVFALVCVFAGCRKVDPGYDGFEAVDLGIGVKWATRNLGATAPEEFGDYFAWGETEPKKQYTWSSYKFHMGGSKTENVIFSKYNPGGTRWGLVDGKSVLDPEDDAAIVRLGGKWRMPTEEDARKLLDNCACEWTELNGVKGFKVTSKVPGYTERWIFFPAAGHYFKDEWDYPKRGCYWTSSLRVQSIVLSYSLEFDYGYNPLRVMVGDPERCVGLPIRPVCD